MTNATEAAPTRAKPLHGLYEFVRSHVLIVNNVIAASATAVALLDFFAPRLSLLPRLVYGATALTVAVMICAALFPRWTERALKAVGAASSPRDEPLWRRPVWQFTVALLLAVSALGFISVAKAERGGALADSFSGVRSAQASLLGLERSAAAIRTGVESANAKLDRIVDRVDPDNPADKCPDMECAIADGASRKTIEGLLAKGKRLPDGIFIAGYFQQLIQSASPARFDIVDIYRERGKTDMRFPSGTAGFSRPAQLDSILEKSAAQAGAPKWLAESDAGWAWKLFQGCVDKTQGGVTIAEFALLNRDIALYQHVRSTGAKLSEMRCDWSQAMPDMSGETTLSDAEIELLTRPAIAPGGDAQSAGARP